MKKLSAVFLAAAAAVFASNASAAVSAPIPGYAYDCDADGFCEGMPIGDETAPRASSEDLTAFVAKAPKMATLADVRGDAVAVDGDPFARPIGLPLALSQSTEIQMKIRDLETFLDGFRTQVGFLAADAKVSISSKKK